MFLTFPNIELQQISDDHQLQWVWPKSFKYRFLDHNKEACFLFGLVEVAIHSFHRYERCCNDLNIMHHDLSWSISGIIQNFWGLFKWPPKWHEPKHVVFSLGVDPNGFTVYSYFGKNHFCLLCPADAVPGWGWFDMVWLITPWRSHFLTLVFQYLSNTSWASVWNPLEKLLRRCFFGEETSPTNKVSGWIGDLKSNWVVLGDKQMSTRMILFSIDEWLSNRMGIEC